MDRLRLITKAQRDYLAAELHTCTPADYIDHHLIGDRLEPLTVDERTALATGSTPAATLDDRHVEVVLALNGQLERLGYRLGRTFSVLGLLEASVQVTRRVQVSR